MLCLMFIHPNSTHPPHPPVDSNTQKDLIKFSFCLSVCFVVVVVYPVVSWCTAETTLHCRIHAILLSRCEPALARSAAASLKMNKSPFVFNGSVTEMEPQFRRNCPSRHGQFWPPPSSHRWLNSRSTPRYASPHGWLTPRRRGSRQASRARQDNQGVSQRHPG